MNKSTELKPEQCENQKKANKLSLQALRDADEKRLRKKYPILTVDDARKADQAELNRMQAAADARAEAASKRTGQ